MKQHILGGRKTALEENFFKNIEKAQLERLREEHRQKELREALKLASGIDDDAVLQKMASLRISPETVAALTLTPLIEVAWADGKIQANERKAILNAANHHGIKKGEGSYDLLETWLLQKPAPALMETWIEYTRELVQSMGKTEIMGLKLALVNKARSVAESAGGFLGLGEKISDQEKEVLDRLESVFV